MISPASRMATVALVAAIALASCSSEADRDTAPDTTEDDPAMAGEQEMLPVEPGGGIGNGAPPLSQASTAAAIPPTLHGRWGLVAADCTSTRSDAKSLLIVTSSTLTFYESVARLDDVVDVGDDNIRAVFDFEGEGMTWKREVGLATRAGGAGLVRREFGENAPGPLEYTRCAADTAT